VAILRVLADESLHIDTIAARTGIPGHLVGGALTVLELTGLVKNIGGMHYIRIL
jgi:predicted Rossmann fold nucleotide-binding protein DprA/Smf involved in DNA uptake